MQIEPDLALTDQPALLTSMLIRAPNGDWVKLRLPQLKTHVILGRMQLYFVSVGRLD
jgi:hypothetical protein